MKAYVTYRYGTNISHIYQMLKENGIEFFDSTSDINYGISLQKTLLNAIKECDFIVIVYTENSGNLGFESGLATALNKPIFSIISSTDNYPDFLIDSMHVNASPEDYDKISYNFNLFIKNLKLKKYNRKKVFKHRIKTRGGRLSDKSWKKEYSQIEFENESAIEHLFEEIFNEFNINFVSQPKNKEIKYRADFSIWSDGLSFVLGNPILIELKTNLTTRNFENTLRQLKEGTESANAKASILFYVKAIKSIEDNISSRCLPNLLIIKISDFINTIDDLGFDQSVVKIRNRVVHNV